VQKSLSLLFLKIFGYKLVLFITQFIEDKVWKGNPKDMSLFRTKKQLRARQLLSLSQANFSNQDNLNLRISNWNSKNMKRINKARGILMIQRKDLIRNFLISCKNKTRI
jgi:hypothetical protein